VASSKKVEKKPVELNALLIRALQSQRFRKVCPDEPSDHSVLSTRLSINIVSIMFLGTALLSSRLFGWSWWLSIALVAATCLALIIVSMIFKFSTSFIAFLFLFLWLGAIIYLIATRKTSIIIFAYLLPIGVILGARWVARSMKLASHVPLFVPLALIIVLLPLLTEDPWRLASEAGARIGVLAAISMIPLGYVLILRIFKTDMALIFTDASNRLMGEPARYSDKAVDLLEKVRDDSNEVELSRGESQATIEAAYAIAHIYLEEIVARAGRSLRIKAIRRLLALLAGISLAIFLLIYILALAAMPIDLAEQWSKHPITFWEPSPFGVELYFPLGPYLLVSALLATVACVGFIGFALTEDQYSEALWDAILRRPAEECLMLAIPYMAHNGRRADTKATMPPTATSPQRKPGSSQRSRQKKK
jgi:hypothetical protein